MTTQKQTLLERVKAGIVFLNAVNPGWVKKIKLDKLNLANGDTCVIGELNENYGKGKENMGFHSGYSNATPAQIRASDRVMERLGFYSFRNSEYLELTDVWKKEIAKLQKKTKQPLTRKTA